MAGAHDEVEMTWIVLFVHAKFLMSDALSRIDENFGAVMVCKFSDAIEVGNPPGHVASGRDRNEFCVAATQDGLERVHVE